MFRTFWIQTILKIRIWKKTLLEYGKITTAALIFQGQWRITRKYLSTLSCLKINPQPHIILNANNIYRTMCLFRLLKIIPEQIIFNCQEVLTYHQSEHRHLEKKLFYINFVRFSISFQKLPSLKKKSCFKFQSSLLCFKMCTSFYLQSFHIYILKCKNTARF